MELGYVPKHKSHEASEALNYLRSIVAHFPKTNQCRGNEDQDKWFAYLTKQEQFHPDLVVTPRLIFQLCGDEFETRTLSNFPIAKSIIKKGKNVVIPTGWVDKIGGHANMLLLNRNRCNFEWFEPNGHYSGDYKQVDPFVNIYKKFRTFVEKALPEIIGVPKSFKFHEPYDECYYILGPQAKAKRNFDACPKGGYCLAFSTLYAHLRFLAPDASGKQTVDTLLKLNGNDLLDLVERYIGWQNSIGIVNTTILKQKNQP